MTKGILFDLKKEIKALEQFHAHYKDRKIGVIYGPKSKEDTFYIRNSKKENLAITAIAASLARLGFTFTIIDPTQKGYIEKILDMDVLFLNMHGEYGEDGRIQGLLDYLDRPYTGSGVLASAVGLDKVLFKKVMVGCGISTPGFLVPNASEKNDIPRRLQEESVKAPWMVKVINGGSSIGMQLIKSEDKLKEFLNGYDENQDKVFIEEYVEGASVTAGVIETTQGLQVLPLIEIETQADFYDEKTKLETDNAPKFFYHVPARFSDSLTQKIQALAIKVHTALGCAGFSRVDFIVNTETDEACVLEINTLPGLSKGGNFCSSANVFGLSYDQVILEILRASTHEE